MQWKGLKFRLHQISDTNFNSVKFRSFFRGDRGILLLRGLVTSRVPKGKIAFLPHYAQKSQIFRGGGIFLPGNSMKSTLNFNDNYLFISNT